MDEAYLSAIFLWASNFAPLYYAYCDGTVLQTNTNAALFSLLNNYFVGGNGSSTFALPDLRGRVAVGTGVGPGLTPHLLGQSGGVETVTLSSNQIPSHTHDLYATTTPGTSNTPSSTMAIATPPNIVITTNNKPVNMYAVPNANTMTALVPGSIGLAIGGGQAHNNMMPYLALSYLICTQGLYPTRP